MQVNRGRRFVRRLFWSTALPLLLACIAGCGNRESSDQPTKSFQPNRAGVDLAGIPEGAVVEVDGSSTVYPVSEAIAEEFRKAANGRATANVGLSGTGGGFKKFCRGEIDVSDASRPIAEAEMKAAKENGIEYIELPICFDAITIAVHPDNDWVDSITVEELKKIWAPESEEKRTRWSHIRADWPDEELRLYGPGTDSGTFDYFTQAIVGKEGASRRDFTASEDDNVLVQGVAGNKFAMGYFGYAYYEPNKSRMKALAIQNGDKPAVKPSLATVLDGSYQPLSRPIFIYVNKKSLEKPAVAAFVEFYLNNVKALSTEVGYVPLPDRAYELIAKRLKNRELGTAFGGKSPVGLRIEEVLEREPKS